MSYPARAEGFGKYDNSSIAHSTFLEWHVCSSSSGNNCHAVHRSLSSGASVYDCTMGFYLVPYCQPSPPTLMEYPTSASLEWHVWPGRRSIYNNWRLNNYQMLFWECRIYNIENSGWLSLYKGCLEYADRIPSKEEKALFKTGNLDYVRLQFSKPAGWGVHFHCIFTLRSTLIRSCCICLSKIDLSRSIRIR